MPLFSSLTWRGTGLELCSTRLEVRARVFDIANVCEATYACIYIYSSRLVSTAHSIHVARLANDFLLPLPSRTSEKNKEPSAYWFVAMVIDCCLLHLPEK